MWRLYFSPYATNLYSRHSIFIRPLFWILCFWNSLLQGKPHSTVVDDFPLSDLGSSLVCILCVQREEGARGGGRRGRGLFLLSIKILANECGRNDRIRTTIIANVILAAARINRCLYHWVICWETSYSCCFEVSPCRLLINYEVFSAWRGKVMYPINQI